MKGQTSAEVQRNIMMDRDLVRDDIGPQNRINPPTMVRRGVPQTRQMNHAMGMVTTGDTTQVGLIPQEAGMVSGDQSRPMMSTQQVSGIPQVAGMVHTDPMVLIGGTTRTMPTPPVTGRVPKDRDGAIQALPIARWQVIGTVIQASTMEILISLEAKPKVGGTVREGNLVTIQTFHRATMSTGIRNEETQGLLDLKGPVKGEQGSHQPQVTQITNLIITQAPGIAAAHRIGLGTQEGSQLSRRDFCLMDSLTGSPLN